MSSRLPISTLVTASLTLAACMAAPSVATEPPSPQAAPPIEVRQQLVELEKEWVTAETKRDSTALRRILDDRFVATLGAAKTYDKEGFIALFVGEVDATASQELTYDAVIIDGDTAVMVATETAHGTRGGAAYTAVYHYTVTYIHRGGQWRALAEHIVRATPPA